MTLTTSKTALIVTVLFLIDIALIPLSFARNKAKVTDGPGWQLKTGGDNARLFDDHFPQKKAGEYKLSNTRKKIFFRVKHTGKIFNGAIASESFKSKKITAPDKNMNQNK